MSGRLLLMASLLLLPLTAPGSSAAASGDARPILHDETRRTIDDIGREVEQWAGRLREHFAFAQGTPAPGPGASPTGERPLVTIMLSHRSELGLTPAQVETLERIRADFQREAVRRDADLRVAEMDLQALRQRDPVDLAAVEAKIREIERLRADFRVGQVRAIEQGRAQLSPEQRDRLRALLSEPRGPRSRMGTSRPPERM